MSFLNRLFGSEADPRESSRPLWHAVVRESRRPAWYRSGHVADTMDGRFDMISAILALVIIRIEGIKGQEQQPAMLTELFVADMEGQLRESGLGDPTVGKHVGRMVSLLGGRIGALRKAEDNSSALSDVLIRNMSMREDSDTSALTAMVLEYRGKLDALDDDALLKGELPQ